ncbi:GNAT family N-acetyltransferase [Nocardioides sp. SR21]|uniref:GNAT family N-acetyltransferase n=1 Tax=Nocardioides sp. SR21 TaxID=2919501 RepID=UPI001FA98239|nr:GNAT family N-acetyltransferase [Nocardioides sp. SR21]
MDIQQVSWDDAEAVRRTTEINEAVRLFEQPWSHPYLAETTALSMRYGWDGEPTDHYLVTVDGTDVAVAQYETATYDNHHIAWFGVDVHPEHRRNGHGSAVLAFLLERARKDGKTSVGMDSWAMSGPEAFAARHGFERKQVSVNRRQRLAKVDRATLDRLHDEALAAAADYELVRRVGATPEAELPALAKLTEAINDAPLDDLEIDDEAYPPERIVAYESAQAGQGHVLHRVYARHRGTGELAGHTVVAVEGLRPSIAHQHDTSVVRSHRGHRLGVLLKTDMVRWLAETQPQVETIDTWNAESNDHMIGVNEALGYEILSRAYAYQRSL